MQKVCTTAEFLLFELYSDGYVKMQAVWILEFMKKNSHQWSLRAQIVKKTT
jgi:hypothetical protein